MKKYTNQKGSLVLALAVLVGALAFTTATVYFVGRSRLNSNQSGGDEVLPAVNRTSGKSASLSQLKDGFKAVIHESDKNEYFLREDSFGLLTTE